MSAPLERPPAARPPLKLLIIACLGFLIVVPLLLRAFVVEAFQTPSGSMMPTLAIGDHIFVNKMVGHPDRGDVIVFKYPGDVSVSYVKRVIGMPGDTVVIEKNQVLVNGKALPRRPHGEEVCSPCLWQEHQGAHTYDVQHVGGRRSDFGPVQVPADSYFVLGDNRDNSNDSRVWGTVPRQLVQGRVTAIWFSVAPEGPIRWNRIGHKVE
jgi:signal peptidase I